LRYISRDKIKYIGILSRLRKLDVPEDIEYFISLSGPEPQRTMLQKKMMELLDHWKGRLLLRAGLRKAQKTTAVIDSGFTAS